jgi:hypothetical protein
MSVCVCVLQSHHKSVMSVSLCPSVPPQESDVSVSMSSSPTTRVWCLCAYVLQSHHKSLMSVCLCPSVPPQESDVCVFVSFSPITRVWCLCVCVLQSHHKSLMSVCLCPSVPPQESDVCVSVSFSSTTRVWCLCVCVLHCHHKSLMVVTTFRGKKYKSHNTKWFKYDRDWLCVNKSQFVPVILEPPCITYNGEKVEKVLIFYLPFDKEIILKY